MMWEGVSPDSWMMYSPRSVSRTSMPPRCRNSLSPDSSPSMDLDLMTLRTRACCAMSSTSWFICCESSAQCTLAPRAVALRSNSSSRKSRCSSALSRTCLAASRIASKLSSSRMTLARPDTMSPRRLDSALNRLGSASFSVASCLNCADRICTTASLGERARAQARSRASCLVPRAQPRPRRRRRRALRPRAGPASCCHHAGAAALRY